MSRTAQQPSLFEEHTVVDADVHLSSGYLMRTEVPQHLTEPYRTRAETSSKPLVMQDAWDRELGGKIERRSARTAEEVQEELCERFHVDVPILSPTLKLSRAPESALAVELMRAYNDVLVEKFLDVEDHFRGLAAVAPRRPEAAAEELDRLGDEDGVVGAIVITTGVSPPLGDPSYDVMYRAAEDNDLTVAFHAAAGPFQLDFPIQYRGFERFGSVHLLAHLWGQTMTMMSLLAHGTPEKFPDLRFVFLEAGIGWIPMMMFRLNKEYAIRKSEMPFLERSPEEYIREFYFGSQPLGESNDPGHMQSLLGVIDAPNSLLFATDYPHWDFDSPVELGGYLEANFEPEERSRILAGNAIEAFGLDLSV